MLRRGGGGCYLLLDVFFSAAWLVISVLGYVDAMTSYNLQKGFNLALQVGGQGFESPELLLAARWSLTASSPMVD